MTAVDARRLRSLMPALALVAGTGLAAQSPTTTMSISGRVMSAATGRPIPGARADVLIADTGVTTTIDAEGPSDRD